MGGATGANVAVLGPPAGVVMDCTRFEHAAGDPDTEKSVAANPGVPPVQAAVKETDWPRSTEGLDGLNVGVPSEGLTDTVSRGEEAATPEESIATTQYDEGALIGVVMRVDVFAPEIAELLLQGAEPPEYHW